MTFEEILDQAIAMLQRRGRLSCRLLKRQFHLDAEALEDLTFELIQGQRLAVAEEGAVLVWTGEPPPPQPAAPRGADAEVRFYALLAEVMALLQRERRVTYRRLTYVFAVDEALLHEVRDELRFRALALDQDGQGLVWTGEAQPLGHPAAARIAPGIAPDATAGACPAPSERAPSPLTLDTPPEEPPVALEVLPADASPDAVGAVPGPARRAPEAERRQLTVMFCDVADSTQLAQQLDPEDLREVIRAYQQTSAEVIHRFDGTIAQHLGDGLLIYFGWPRAHEDDAQRALYAGLGLVEAITRSLNPRLHREKGVQLAVRLGIHTGPVVVGAMGGGRRHENLATGDTVNIASRLEGLAMPNTVVISSMTERLVQHTFALEPLGRHDLKGVAEPMALFRVLGPIEAYRAEDEDHVAAGVPFLVGRDEEVGLLVRRWEQSKEGLGQVVQLSGEAGIGKSALVEVLRAHIRAEGLPRIAFHCSPYHQNSALYPVIAHLEHLLHFEREDTPEAKLDKLEQRLQMYSLPLDEVVPLVAALLSVPLHGRYAMPTLPPQQQKQQTLDALVAWLVDEAERQPLLLVWENLHWADPSTLEMLALVLEQTPTVPMLSVLTFRPEFRPPWPMRSHMTPITLNRLERPQVEALITHLAGGKALPDEVVQHIVTKTDGVPLYVEELTKMLLASALLREDVRQYVLTGPLLTVAIPDTLQDSLMARLDQLNTAKEVAQLGAVLGREFSYEMIQMVSSQDEATLQAGLARLVEAELLYRRGRPPRAKYLFKHALIQDAAYASLLRSTRQQVHQQVAQLLETRFPELVETQPELLAHHYTEAGCIAQAVVYWQKAGRSAVERSAHVEGLRHLTQGLEALKTLPDTPARAQQELVLQTTLGSALIATKGYAAPEVEHAYSRARELCRQVGETPRILQVLLGLDAFHMVRGEIRTARELGEQCLALARRMQDPTRLVQTHYALGMTLFHLGELAPARQHLEQGLALYNPQHHRPRALQDPGVSCLAYTAWALWYLGYPHQAVQRGHAAIALAQELSHPYSLAFALDFVATVHQLCREGQAAQQRAEAVIALCREQKFPFWSAWGIILRGWVLVGQGQVDEGIAQMHQGLADWRAAGVEVLRSHFLALLAEAHGKAAQAEEGLRVLAEALAVVDKNGERYYEAELYRLKGELLLARSMDHQAEAETCFRHALDMARQQQAKSWELRAATSLARLWRRQGKRQEAYDLLAPVYEWFTEGFDTTDLQEAKALLQALQA